MCLFTHFAAGALAGGLTGNVWFGAAAGVASHAVLDAIPHYDHPDWRLELAAGVFSLILLLLMPFATWAAVVGGIFGMVPDLENLFQKLGKMRRDQFIFPSHTGLIPHGRALGPRSIVWQVAIFVVCFGLLGILTPGAAHAAQGTDAQPVMGDPVVRLLSSDEYMTRIQVNCPVERQPVDWSAVNFDNIQWGVKKTFVQDGTGEITIEAPRLELNIAVPTTGAVNTNVVGVDWWKEPVVNVSNSELASFGLPAVYREVPITGSSLPLGIGGGVLRSAIIEIHHQPNSHFSRQLQAAAQFEKTDKNLAYLEKTPYGILNSGVFKTLAQGGHVLLNTEKSSMLRGEFNHFDLTSHWVRLSVDKNGLHRLTGQELSSMGVSTTDVDPEKIRLYRGGSFQLDSNPEIPEADQADRVGLQEVAIQVLAGMDGEWNLDDEIRFYAFSSDFWTDRADPDAGHLEHYNHPYQDEGLYWLTWENLSTATPIPGAPMRVAEVNAPANGGTDLNQAKMRLHMERQIREGYGFCVDNWLWDNSIYYTKTLDFDLFAPVADSTATFVIDYRGLAVNGSRNDDRFMSRAWINEDTDHVWEDTFVVGDMPDSMRIRLVGASSSMVEGHNELMFENSNIEKDQPLVLDSFDIFYWGRLELDGLDSQLEFAHWREHVGFAGQQVNLKVSVPLGENIILWEVGDVQNPTALNSDISGTQLTCGLTLESVTDHHFIATSENYLHSVVSGVLDSPINLRQQSVDAHYVIVYPEIFADAAQNLKEFRSSYLPGISNPIAHTVTLKNIYDNFSGGQRDVRAIRNYLKWVYESGGGNLQFVCLLGNGSRDHRNYLNVDPETGLMDLLPADHRTHFPRNVKQTYVNSAYGSDDTVVSFDHAPLTDDVDFPDVNIGRLPAISVSEANNLVDKMIQYSSTVEPGLWNNRILMVSDDCVSPKYSPWPDPVSIEHRHTLQEEVLSTLFIPQSIDQVKVLGVSYDFPPGSGAKPQARQDINSYLSEGVTMFSYVGHGAENNLADEQMFRSQDIPNLTNGMKRGVFIAFSCDVGVYDNPTRRSMAELFIVAENGGAIASICASQASYSHLNDPLSNAFFGALFPDQHVLATKTLSEALVESKASRFSSGARHNSQRYNLLCDPAVSLPHPVDDLDFAVTSIDTLRAGARQVAVLDDGGGMMLGVGDTYNLWVEESGYDEPYIYAYTSYDGDGDPLWDSVFQKGSTVFNGHGTMNSSELRVAFKVPTQLRYGDDARVRLILNGLDEDHAAISTVSAVRQAIGINDDLMGPQINLAFEDNRYRVKAGTELTATLQDTSSIAILGTTPGNSLLLEFDDSGFMTDVTTNFVFDADSYTNGRISIPLPGDLPLGNHQAALHASDVLGNVGNDTISFVIVPQSVVGMESITLFPNPTPGPCRLIFELSDPMSVKWEIYTLSGHCIKRVEKNLAAGPQIIPWDGRDDMGDEIANGTYLYVLRGNVAGDGDRDITETGKLVIMK